MSEAQQISAEATAAPQIPTRPEVPAWKLILTLAVAGVTAGLLLVFVNQVTAPLIKENDRQALSRAVREVLKGPARIVSMVPGTSEAGHATFVPEAEVNYEVDAEKLDRVFLGYDEHDQPVGFAISHVKAGFADPVRLIFGYDPRTKKVLGMKVLYSKETPGLGDKVEKDPKFVQAFDGVTAPLVPVKPGKGSGSPQEIDTITGATISSKCVIDIINLALGKIGPRLDQWVQEGAR